MKQKYSIGFFVVVILAIIIIAGSSIVQNNNGNEPNEHIQKTQTEQIENGYWIKEVDGYIQVYFLDEDRVFEESSILIDELPLSLKKKIKEGLYLHSELEVYSFLENYSS